MVQFRTSYYSPMDRNYLDNEMSKNRDRDIEKPTVPISELGQSVTEGRQFGSFIQSATAAIRGGAGTIELQTQMGGGAEPQGAESYGTEARQALRELAAANKVILSSVHTPTNVGNLSGFNPQRGSFEDEMRKSSVEEVKSAIRFAADATQGGAVVLHTGEYQRPMFDAPWNKGDFVAYNEEPTDAVRPLVDDRSGKILTEVRMNQLVPQAVWNKYEKDSVQWKEHNGKVYADDKGNMIYPGDYIGYEGEKLERANRVPKYDAENNTFVIVQKKWQDFEKDAEEINQEKEKKLGRKLDGDERVKPEEAFLIATTETQEKISRGWAGNYSQGLKTDMKAIQKLKDAKTFYINLEKNIPEDEMWKILRRDQNFSRHIHNLVQDGLISIDERKKPSELIEDTLGDLREDLKSKQEMITGQLQQAEEQKIMRQHAVAANKYALEKTFKSYGELGVDAMKESHHNPYAKRDIFVAPENIFPEMGYGSHPEELIELVKKSRQKMVQYLTSPEIPDLAEHRDKDGNIIKVPNPYYTGMSKEEAEKEAKDHIKATLDTQHLGMWYRYFKPLQNEKEDDRRERFNKWYMDEVEKMSKEDIIGNIHLVDSVGGGHQHLPAGQGDLPVVQAINYLKKNGYKGSINSEAYGEERFGQGRILLETWRAFGSPVYGTSAGGTRGPSWTNIQHSYFGQTYPPYFIFGAYAPSNEWTLWSQVPME